MILEEMQRLWPIAKALHEARRDLAWGKKLGAVREPWPEWSTAYSHNPIAYVDLALAQAEASEEFSEERHEIEAGEAYERGVQSGIKLCERVIPVVEAAMLWLGAGDKLTATKGDRLPANKAFSEAGVTLRTVVKEYRDG